MGNTPSSPTSSLRRDPSFISRPQALGSILRRSRTRPLGPEHIISPFTEDPSPTQEQPPSASSQNSISKRHLVEDDAPARHTPGHRRSQTFAASQSSHHPNNSAVDIRRSRSANVTGPDKADRSSHFLGAPPPYSPVDSPSPSHGDFLDVPRGSHWEKGHRRAASEEAPGHRRFPTGETYQTDGSGYEDEDPIPEEFGYGVGSGIRPGSFSHNRMRRLPPLPAETPSTFPDEIVSSPTSALPPVQNREDPLELLKQYKTIFIIDDSASMAGERWAETREALASLADTAAKYGTDGIDACFLNANRSAQNMRSATSVKRQFDSVEPQGISLLARRLEELLNDYIAELEQAQREIRRGDIHALRRIKPVNYIIITDGVPTDDPEAVIIQAARRLDRANLPIAQVGIQFVQVGDDPRATEALRELDDEIAKEYGIRDMVDTTPYSGGPLDSELLIKILLGGISRRVDKKGARSIM